MLIKKSARLFLSAFLLLYHLLINVGQIVISICFPFITLELGYLLEPVVGIVAVVARRVSPKVETFVSLALCQRYNLRKQLLSATLHCRDKERQIQILICPHIAIDLWRGLAEVFTQSQRLLALLLVERWYHAIQPLVVTVILLDIACKDATHHLALVGNLKGEWRTIPPIADDILAHQQSELLALTIGSVSLAPHGIGKMCRLMNILFGKSLYNHIISVFSGAKI